MQRCTAERALGLLRACDACVLVGLWTWNPRSGSACCPSLRARCDSNTGATVRTKSRMYSSRDIVALSKSTDLYLAPAITRFAIKVGYHEGHDPTMTPEENELRTEILALHQKWSKDCGELGDNDVQESVDINADVPQKFTRTVQRKNQQWEQDSRSRAEFDPDDDEVNSRLQCQEPTWEETSCFMK